jgi:hypothetical protein
MIRRRRALKTLAVAATAAIAPFNAASHAQDFGVRSMKPSSYPEEKRPKVDEKAYKAALEKIPVPTEKYDPWGSARPADPAKAGKKLN